jgi:hypothetical protein
MTGSVAQSRRSRRPVNQSKILLFWRSPSFALHSTSQIYVRHTSRCERPCPRLLKHMDQRYAVSDIWYVVGRSARHGDASLNGPLFVSNRRNNSLRQSQRVLTSRSQLNGSVDLHSSMNIKIPKLQFLLLVRPRIRNGRISHQRNDYTVNGACYESVESRG